MSLQSASSSTEPATKDLASMTTTPAATFEPKTFKPPKLSTFQFINLTVGIIGIQFAWSMQIALSHRVLEPLGADPLLYGLIWCAGPISGLLVQPLIGAVSDQTWTKLGRRRPFILGGALLGMLALLFFPYAPTLLIGALLIWVIDAVVNVAQGPYRALVPDTVPNEQTTVANSFLNAGFGIGSVIALGTAPLLHAFNIEMSIEQQYMLAAFALFGLNLYTSLLIREYKQRPGEPLKDENAPPSTEPEEKKPSLLDAFRAFAKADREIHKVSAVQFLTWVGVMCLFIYLTPLVVHSIYKLPDASSHHYKLGEKVYSQLDERASTLVEQVSPQALTELHLYASDNLATESPEGWATILGEAKTDTQAFSEDAMGPLTLAVQQYAASGGILSENYGVSLNPDVEQLETKRLISFIEDPELKRNIIASQPLVPVMKQTNPATLQALAQNPEEARRFSEALVIQKAWLSQQEGDPGQAVMSATPTQQSWLAQSQWFHLFHELDNEAVTTSQKALVALNLMALLLSVPLGKLANKFGKKPIFALSLACMSLGFGAITWVTTPNELILAMAFAGVAWATILSIPFAFLCDYMPKGQEGSIMGIFNMFIAGPQLISATVVSWMITQIPVETSFGHTHYWPLAFQIAAVFVALAIVMLMFVRERRDAAPVAV